LFITFKVRDSEGDKPAQLDESFEYANEILVSLRGFCIFTAAEKIQSNFF